MRLLWHKKALFAVNCFAKLFSSAFSPTSWLCHESAYVTQRSHHFSAVLMWCSQDIWYHTHIWQENKSSVSIRLLWGAERVMFESMNSMLLHGSFDQPVGFFYSHFCELFVFKWELRDSGFDTAFSHCFEVPAAFSKGMMFYFRNQALVFVTWWEHRYEGQTACMALKYCFKQLH